MAGGPSRSAVIRDDGRKHDATCSAARWHPGLPSHDCGVTGRLRVEMACMAHPAALRRPARRGPGAHVVAHEYIPHVVRVVVRAQYAQGWRWPAAPHEGVVARPSHRPLRIRCIWWSPHRRACSCPRSRRVRGGPASPPAVHRRRLAPVRARGAPFGPGCHGLAKMLKRVPKFVLFDGQVTLLFSTQKAS